MGVGDVYTYSEDDDGVSGFQRHFSNGNHFMYASGDWNMCATWDRNGPDTGGSPVPLVIYCHGGHVTSPYSAGPSRGFLQIADVDNPSAIFDHITRIANCNLLSMEFSPGQHTPAHLTYSTFKFAPSNIFEAARVVQWARQNANNPEVFPTPVDVDKIIFYGFSQGAQNGLFAYLTPRGFVSQAGSISNFSGTGFDLATYFNIFDYDYDHRPNAVIAGEPFVDPSQATTGLPESTRWYFDHEIVSPGDVAASVDMTPRSIMRATGPMWWLLKNLPGNRNLRICLYYNHDNNGQSWVFNLGVTDPNLTNTHSHKNAQPWADEMVTQGHITDPPDANDPSEVWYGDGVTAGSIPTGGAQVYTNSTDIVTDYIDKTLLAL